MSFGAPARKRNTLAALFLCGMGFCNLALIYQSLPYLRNGYQDFTIYYTGARLLREGRSAELYNGAAQYQSQLAFTSVPIRQGALPYNHPPFEALFFVPFTLLRYWPAYLLWTALNLIMLLGSAILLRRFPGIKDLSPPQMALAILAYFPLMLGLMQGQDVILLLFVMMLALELLRVGKEERSGACLAIGLFRPHVILPLVLMLAVRRWRLLLGFIPMAFALYGISALAAGWAWPLTFIRFVVRLERGRVGNYGPQVSPNIRGLVGELVAAFHGSTPIVSALVAASTLAVLGLAIRRIYRGNDSATYAFCLASIVAILVSFHALCYDLTVLLPVVLFLFASVLSRDRVSLDVTRPLLLTLLFLAPLHLYLQTVADRFFWFGLVLLGLFVWMLRIPSPAAEPS